MELTRYYAQIDARRRAVCLLQTHATIDAPHMIELPEYDESVLGKLHNDATGAWEPDAEQAAHRKLSVLAFRRRFTLAERAGIEWAAVDRADQPEAQRQQAAMLRASLADQAAAKFIDLDDATTVEGVQGMEAMGLIAPGRAAEILGAAVQPEELP